MEILDLVLKHKWFDMIASNIKKEEYREIREYWDKRLKNKKYDAVRFHRGYTNNTILLECKGIKRGIGNKEWGAPEKEVYIISLGNIIRYGNI